MGSLRLIVGLILALAISSFGVINMNPVTVAYYQGSINLPLFYVLLVVFACGFMVAWLGGTLDRLKFRNQIVKLKREVKTLESNLGKARKKSGKFLPMGNPDTDDSANTGHGRASEINPKSEMSLSPRESRAE